MQQPPRFHLVLALTGFSSRQHMPAFDRETCNISGSPCTAGPYTFQGFEAWDRPGLSPAPSEALKLLHRLAADRCVGFYP